MSISNSAKFCGNLGDDPKIFRKGDTVTARFSLATKSRYKDKDGNRRTDWHRIVCFGKTAEFAEQYLFKGREVSVEGEVRYDKYTDQNGVEKYSTDIHVYEIKPHGKGRNGEEQAPESVQAGADDIDPDDIPF